MGNVKKKSFWSKLWSVVHPVLTLGLSLLIANASKKAGALEDVVNTAGIGIVNEVLDEVTDIIDKGNDQVNDSIK